MANRRSFIQSLGVFLGGLATGKKSPRKKQEIEVPIEVPNPHQAKASNFPSSSALSYISATTWVTYTATTVAYPMEFKNEKKPVT